MFLGLFPDFPQRPHEQTLMWSAHFAGSKILGSTRRLFHVDRSPWSNISHHTRRARFRIRNLWWRRSGVFIFYPTFISYGSVIRFDLCLSRYQSCTIWRANRLSRYDDENNDNHTIYADATPDYHKYEDVEEDRGIPSKRCWIYQIPDKYTLAATSKARSGVVTNEPSQSIDLS